MKYCSKHKNLWATQDFKEYKCEKCEKFFMDASCPSHEVCMECSDKYDLCYICGKKIDKYNFFDTLNNYYRKNEKTNTKLLEDDKYYIVRIDGKNFSKFTERYFKKPFDQNFILLMNKTIKRLIQEFENNILLAYHQSDEVSFLISNKVKNLKARKLLSHIPSAFSSIFNQESGIEEIVIFDSRLIELKTKKEVENYFIWRFLDCQRNSLNTFIYWSLVNDGDTKKTASKKLEKMTREEKMQFANKNNFSYNDLSISFKNGNISKYNSFIKEGYNPISKTKVFVSRRKWQNFEIESKESILNILNETLKLF